VFRDRPLRQVRIFGNCFSGRPVIGARDKILPRRDTKTFGEVRLHRSNVSRPQLAGCFRGGASPGHQGHEVVGRN